MEDSKILEKIKAQESINEQGVWKRHDTDYDFFTLKEYELKDYDGDDFKESYSYTSPAPLNFHISLASIINQSTMTFEVNSKEFDDVQSTVYEGVYRALWNSMVSWFSQTYPGKVGLREIIEQFIALRGSVCTRVLCQIEQVMNADGEIEDMLVTEAFPHDPRHCVWEISRSGKLDWFSRIGEYTKAEAVATFGTKPEYVSQIESAYGNDSGTRKVREYWDKDNYIIFIAEKAVVKDKNTKRIVPFVVKNSKLGILLDSKNSTNKYVGESILQTLRVVIEHENRIKSVNSTKHMETFRRALALTGKDAVAAAANMQGTQKSGPDSITGESYPIVPVGDAKFETLYPAEASASDQYEMETILADKQESMFHEFERAVANSGQPWSGAALRVLAEQKDKILIPVVQSIQEHITDILMMARLQIVRGELSGDLGGQGEQETYSYEQFKGKYSFKACLEAETKDRIMANIALAEKYLAMGAPPEIAWEYAGIKDPHTLARKIRIREMERGFPVVATYNALISEIEAVDSDPARVRMLLLITDRLADMDIAGNLQVDSQIAQLKGVSNTQGTPSGGGGFSPPNQVRNQSVGNGETELIQTG